KEEILDRRLNADRGIAPESRKNIGADGRNLERDEDEHQLDRRRHQHHADGAQQNQPVIFAVPNLLHVQVLERSEDHDSGYQSDQHVEENAEGIHAYHAEEGEAGVLRLIKAGEYGKYGAGQRQNAEAFAIIVLAEYRFDEHHEQAEHDQDEFGQKSNVVSCRNHCPLTRVCKDACAVRPGLAGALGVACAAVLSLETNFCAAPSMARVQISGATPMIRAAATKGHKVARSRAFTSVSARLSLFLKLP